MPATVERKYALTRIKAGDYLLPSNDGNTIWRIAKYVEGPSTGIEDWPRDRDVWGVWRRTGSGLYVDLNDWDCFAFHGGMYNTRADAIAGALLAQR